MGSEPVTAPPARARWVALLRALWPWLVGIAIVAVIATRVPFEAFRDGIRNGPHVQLALVTLLIYAVLLCTDSVATWVGLIALRMRRPFAAVFAMRGVTALLSVINYAFAQAGFGYYLHRSGERPLRAAGAASFLLGINLATLLVMTSVAWTARPSQIDEEAVRWLLLVGVTGFAVYLAVIAWSPTILSRRQILAPLFDAHLRGHALAMLGRVPHVTAMVLGHWVAMRVWGIAVPFWVGATIMPAVVIAASVPISPGGLGTTQAAMVFFFEHYARGATGEERAAAVLSFGVVYFVFGVAAAMLLGVACTWVAKGVHAVPSAPIPVE